MCLSSRVTFSKSNKLLLMQWEMVAGGLVSQQPIFHAQGTLCTAFRGNSSQCNGRFIILIFWKISLCACVWEGVCMNLGVYCMCVYSCNPSICVCVSLINGCDWGHFPRSSQTDVSKLISSFSSFLTAHSCPDDVSRNYVCEEVKTPARQIGWVWNKKMKRLKKITKTSPIIYVRAHTYQQGILYMGWYMVIKANHIPKLA